MKLYTDKDVSYLLMNLLLYVAYVTFEGHICCLYIHGKRMVNKCYSMLLFK